MKKILLGTTAIVAAGMIVAAPAAFAAEKIKLSVGGYMEQWVGYVSNDDAADQDYSGVDVKSDAEIHFKGSTKLDNGITVGVNVQLEANQNGGDQIDESYMTISGGFGSIDIGSENSVQYRMHIAPSEFGIGINSGDQTAWLSTISDASGDSISEGGAFRQPFGATYVEPLGANDSEKISWFSPRVEGIQLGLSYSPDTNQDSNASINRDAVNSDLVMAAVNFKKTFDGTALAASLGYGTVTSEVSGSGDNASAVNAGIRVSSGGAQIGVSYANFEDSGGNSGAGMNVGTSYKSGPWGVSLNYFHGEKDGTGSGSTLDGEATMDTVFLSGKYAMGPGVTAAGTIGHSSISSDDADLDASVDSISATYVVVGLKVSF